MNSAPLLRITSCAFGTAKREHRPQQRRPAQSLQWFLRSNHHLLCENGEAKINRTLIRQSENNASLVGTSYIQKYPGKYGTQ